MQVSVKKSLQKDNNKKLSEYWTSTTRALHQLYYK